MATFDVESGVDVSADLTAMARVREAAAKAHEHRMALAIHDPCVIDLPDLAPAASFHHTLSLGTLAVICTGERPAPDPEKVRAERVREAREAEERAAEEERARKAAKPPIIPFVVTVAVLIGIVVSIVGTRSCNESHGSHPKDEKAEHRK